MKIVQKKLIMFKVFFMGILTLLMNEMCQRTAFANPPVVWSISGYVFDVSLGESHVIPNAAVTLGFGLPWLCNRSCSTDLNGFYHYATQCDDYGSIIYATVEKDGYYKVTKSSSQGSHTGHVLDIGLEPILADPVGDADRNKIVNADDYHCVRDHFGQHTYTFGDADRNGFVNGNDYRAVRDHFGQVYSK